MLWSPPMALFAFACLYIHLLLVSGSHFSSAEDRISAIKYCDFECIHGRCDRQTRACVCSPGWMGADCDLCPLGLICPQQSPSLSLVLPQASSVALSNASGNSSLSPPFPLPSVAFVSVLGNAFPKGPRARYDCLFGTSLSKGRWVSPSLVRCPVPAQSVPGKYAFSIVPEGSPANGQIASQGTSHFTFFVPCSSAQCRGFCFGPLCLCAHSQFGNFCEEITDNTTTLKMSLNNGTAVTWATEFQPFFVKIPNSNELSRLNVQSDIADLELNSLDGLLSWPSPLGRVRPYSVGLRAKFANGTTFVANWTLKVKPSYSAQLDKPMAENSNGFLVTGEIIWKETKAKPNRSIPLLLRVSQNDHFVEQIVLRTEPNGRKFSFILFNYLGFSGKISITSAHPGISSGDSVQIVEAMDAIEWIQKWAEVTQFDAELKVEEGRPFDQNYSLRMAPTGEKCPGQWHFEVIEPREMIGVENATFEDGTNVRLRFRPLALSAAAVRHARPLVLKTAFICMPTGQSQVIRQKINGIGTTAEREENELEMEPNRLFVDIDDSPQALAVFTLDISVPSRRADLLQRVHLESTSFSPFALLWLSRPSANSWRLWLSLRADQLEKEANSDGALLIRGGENLALSIPYHIQRSSSLQLDDFLFTLTVNDPSFFMPSLSNSLLRPTADVELFSQRNGQHFVRSVPFNVPVQFGPIRSDIFQLRIRSRDFRPFSSLAKIDPMSNSLIVHLRRVPNQYLAFDGQKFAMEWEESADGTAFRPRVRLSPSEMSDANDHQFAHFVYSDGPPNSFAWLSPSSLWPSSSLPNATLCLGCGFRLRLRLRSFPSVPSHCAALSVPFSFSASLPSGGSIPFRQFFLITAAINEEKDGILKREWPNKGICHSEEDGGRKGELPHVALRSPIFRSCPQSKLRRCQSLFHPPGPKCAQWWAQLPDDLLTVHTVAQFLLLSVHCRREGADLEEMAALIECIEAVDRDCPLHPSEAEMAPHRGAQLFNQMGHLKPYRAGLHSLFPAVSLIESQLANFPTFLSEFLSQLKLVFPSSSLLPLSSPVLFDHFVASIADNSSQGPMIEGKETSGITEQLVVKWNRAVNLVSGREAEELEEGEGTEELAKWRELVRSADRVKSVARQFGAENPFSLFSDVLRRIFVKIETNDEAENYQTEETIAWADVRTDQEEVGEDEEFRVLVTVRVHEFTSVVLSSLGITLRFPPVSAALKFRLGPIFNFGNPSELRAGDTFRAEWTVLPFSEFRLTESIQFEPILTLSFQLDGQRMAQRLSVPSVSLRPRPSLRLLAFSLPSFVSSSSAHSLHISAINSGYSDLNSVELRELRPDIKWADNGTPVDFRFSNVHVEGNDGQPLPEGSFLSFGHKIASGNASHMTLSFGVTGQQSNRIALFRNFSAVVSVNGSLLPPSQIEQRFFLVQQSVRALSVLLVSEHASPLPLYLYSKPNSQLTPLATLQLVEEKEIRSVMNGHHFLSRVFALRRLALFPSPLSPDASVPPRVLPPASSSHRSAAFSSLPIASVFATLRVNNSQTFGEGIKLLRISELSQNKRRQIDKQFVWTGEESDEKMTTINFVDLDASASVPQLFYELLFGRPEHFRAPFFAQAVYSLRLSVPSSVSRPGLQQVLARITAFSPLDLPLNYSLLSPLSECPFSVVPSTGDIVVTHPLLDTFSVKYCMNLVATDQKGMQTRVPIQIELSAEDGQSQNGGGEEVGGMEPKECGVFEEGTELFEHEFKKTQRQTTDQSTGGNKGDEKTTENEAEETTPPTMSASPSLPILVEMGGDSTLPSVLFSPGIEVTAEVRDTPPNDVTSHEELTVPGTRSTPSFSNGVSPTAGGSPQMHSHQQFLTAYPPHRAMFSTTKAPLPALQLAGVGTAGSQQRITGGTRRNSSTGTETQKIVTMGIQREENRAVETGQSSAQTMAEMACRLRTTKPIWALICDMAKTVYRTTILNTR
ncbi:hypothetical protein niasHT_001993 [Heterodera trifolii]|uniref:EGF-like domain-containing protein n=1 Tax=Heterodera trifolii TaxID=157864 RepID=A0ABD2M4S7_9BILA